MGSPSRRWRDGYLSGSLTISSLTAGSILFAGSGGLITQDNVNLYWDNVNKRLGIGTTSPSEKLHVVGNINLSTSTSKVFFGSPTKGYIGTDGYNLVLNSADYGADIVSKGTIRPWSDAVYDLGVSGFRFRNLNLTGEIVIGGDTRLYRSAADQLKTDDSLDVYDLDVGGVNVITSGRILQNVSADAGIITSGRFSFSRLPTDSVGNRFLVVRTPNSDPVYDTINVSDVSGFLTQIAGDDTEISTTSTTYPTSDQKYFYMTLCRGIFPLNKLAVSVEGKVTSGYTLYVGIYVDGTLKTELSWTETSYTVKVATGIDLSGLSTTVTHQVGIRMRVTGGTGYVRAVDFYWTR
ncbi:MAG: hypothetical protein QXR62_04800 [Candidatus Bathyarchaeia archaeon]